LDPSTGPPIFLPAGIACLAREFPRAHDRDFNRLVLFAEPVLIESYGWFYDRTVLLQKTSDHTGWVGGLAVMVPIILLPIAFELRVTIVYVLLVDGVRFATFLGKGIRIKDIKDGVARLMNVNPFSLAKLGQWNEDDTDGERQSDR